MAKPIDRATIVAYYLKSIRTAEYSAARQLSPFIADDAVSTWRGESYKGHDEVLERATGKWPHTNFVHKAGFSDPVEENGKLVVTAVYPPDVNSQRVLKVTFTFNDQDQIQEVDHEMSVSSKPEKVTELPLIAKALLEDALTNETPPLAAYVDEQGRPVVTPRGSFMFLGQNQVTAWLRHATGGMATALQSNPNISIFYRDHIRKQSVVIQGKAHISEDPELKEAVFAMLPEVEQQHVPDRSGALLVVDIESLQCQVGGKGYIYEP